MTDFENNGNLGLIFPEKYYKTLFQFGENINSIDLRYINNILSKLYPRIHISSEFIDFPEGNMFWAKIKAIYPIFTLKTKLLFTPKYSLMMENNLEKIWIYLVKLNGYLYRKIFKHDSSIK